MQPEQQPGQLPLPLGESPFPEDLGLPLLPQPESLQPPQEFQPPQQVFQLEPPLQNPFKPSSALSPGQNPLRANNPLGVCAVRDQVCCFIVAHCNRDH